MFVTVPVPELRTERLLLRGWRAGDREPFAALNADPVVMEHFPAPLSRAESDAFVDRIEECPDGSKILVEIKNRTNRLFRRVVPYEYVQVQVYLRMVGLVHARIVEQYNNQVLSHDITRDEEMWSNVIEPGLREFCSDFHQAVTQSGSS